jgi:beta-lactamase regulating signal transducer with metallopeptidase domain
MAAGVFHPVVLLPPSAVALGPSHLDVVLAHELAHHRAHDLLFERVLAVVTTVWWFNPVVWALAARIREVREDRCDDRVLMLGVDPRTYCRVLLDVAAARLNSPALAIRHIMHPLERRFARLLAPRRAVVARQVLAVPVTIVFASLALPHSSWSPWDRADDVRPAVSERVRVVVEQRVVR